MFSNLKPRMPAILGFVLVFGLFLLGLRGAMSPTPIELDPEKAAKAAKDPEVVRVYQALDAPIDVLVPATKKAVHIVVAVALEDKLDHLITLKDRVDQERPALMADLLALVQAEAEIDPDPARLRAELPEKLRAALNAKLSTPEIPDPIKDVYFTQFLTQ